MKIEGDIVAVMETWPLQVSIDTAEGRRELSLHSETRVDSGGDPADPSLLAPGQRVRIEALPTASGLRVESVSVLAGGAGTAPPEGPEPAGAPPGPRDDEAGTPHTEIEPVPMPPPAGRDPRDG